MKNFLFLLTALFALSANQASADDLYAGVFGGPNWLNMSKKHVKADFDVGYIVGGTIGYRWCGGLRFEGEIAYRNNQIKSAHLKNTHHHHNDGSSSSNEFGHGRNHHERLKGHFQTVSYMANVIYDWPFECSCWKVYVGGGIGYANQKFNHHNKKHHRHHHKDLSQGLDGAEIVTADEIVADEIIKDCDSESSSSSHRRHCHKSKKDNNGFAAQAIVGVGYNICENLDLVVEYRYFYAHKNFTSSNNALVFGVQTGF